MRTLRRLLAFAAMPPARVGLSVFLGALAVCFGVALMTAAGYLISRAAEHPPVLSLTVTIVAVRFFGLSRPIVRYFDRLVSHDLALRALGRIRARFYERVEPLAPAQLEGYRRGDLLTRMATCCKPVPGDPIFGFITRSGGVSVHRADCTNADELRQQADRMVSVEWKPTAASMFLVAVQVEALDRHKLLADVTRALSDERVNILSAMVTTTRDRVAVSRFTFEMADPKHLGHLLTAVRKIDGVYDAYRVTSGS